MDFIYFRIWGNDIRSDEITKKLGIKPEMSCKKGEQRVHRGETITYREDFWLISKTVENTDRTEQEIRTFLISLYKHKEYILSLSKKFNVTLWVTVYNDGIQRNLHFSNEILKMINELGIDLDLTHMNL